MSGKIHHIPVRQALNCGIVAAAWTNLFIGYYKDINPCRFSLLSSYGLGCGVVALAEKLMKIKAHEKHFHIKGLFRGPVMRNLCDFLVNQYKHLKKDEISQYNMMPCNYRQIYNISHMLICNKIVDHSGVIGTARSNYIFVLTPDFNRLHRDNCKTRQETFKFCDLVQLILEILWYMFYYVVWMMQWIFKCTAAVFANFYITVVFLLWNELQNTITYAKMCQTSPVSAQGW